MQYQRIFIIFSIIVCKITTNTDANSNSVKIEGKLTDNSEIDEVPSPEWIKYQQERFKDSDKLTSKYQDIIQKKVQPIKAAVSKVELSKIEKTSREEAFNQDGVEQIDFENNISQHSEESSADKMNSAVEFPSIQGFIEFIKSLKQTWMKKSLFGIDDKIKMLHQLKDSLLKAIEKKFTILWQDDENESDMATTENTRDARKMGKNNRDSHLRSKRGILGESNINFPPDAALMSINFLTFAVFLIKLVLQVVNIVKTKHYQFSTFNMNSGAIRNG